MQSAPNAPAGQAGNEASADNQFTHANLFGMYLTLVFCVSTQPLGNLLMDLRLGAPAPPPKRLSLFLLWFWRLNPIACGAEGWLILVIVGKRATELWGSKSLVREDMPLGLRLARLLDRMHVVATSLLIIRAQQVDETGQEVAEQLIHLAKPYEKDEEVILPPDWSHVALPRCDEHPQPVARPTSLRHGVEEMLHPGVLTRNEGWVDAVTILSIVTTTAKLAAITLPWQLRVALLLMIVGWLAITLLMLLSHCRDFESLNKRAVAWEVLQLSKLFPWLEVPSSIFHNQIWRRNPPWYYIALSSPVIPILVYLSYAITFVLPMYETNLEILEKNSRAAGIFYPYGLTFTPMGIFIFIPRFYMYVLLEVILFLFLPVLLMLGIGNAFLNSSPDNPARAHPTISVCLWFLFTFLFAGICQWSQSYLIRNYTVQYDLSIRAMVFIVMVMLKVGCFIYLYTRRQLTPFFLFFNPVILGFVVFIVFKLYSPNGSFKPSWLDWLG